MSDENKPEDVETVVDVDEIEIDDSDDAKSAVPAARSAKSASTMSPAWAVASMLAVLGLVVGIIGGYFGVRSYLNRGTEDVRDSVLLTAETAALNITTIDPKNPDKFRQNIESVMTGRALQELRGKGFQELLDRKDSPGKLESRVARSAATEVNRGDKAGKALVYVEVLASAPNQPQVKQIMGFLISVRKIDGKYLAETVVPYAPIPVQDQPTQPNPGAPQPNPAPRQGGN